VQNKSIRGDSKKEDNQMKRKQEKGDEYGGLGDIEWEGLLTDNKSWEVFGPLTRV
jgi:hypothetical protein